MNKRLKIGRNHAERILIVDIESGLRTWLQVLFDRGQFDIVLTANEEAWQQTVHVSHGQKMVLEDGVSGSKIAITMIVNGPRKSDQVCLIFEAPESCRIWREEIVPKEYKENGPITNAERIEKRN